jgi:hypothetical protein
VLRYYCDLSVDQTTEMLRCSITLLGPDEKQWTTDVMVP